MNFDLSGPCANCPFRTDVATNYGWLGQARAAGIAEDLNEYTFPCHKTTVHDDFDEEYDTPQERPFNAKEQHCYGALVVLKNEGKLFDNRMLQIAQRLKIFTRYDQLNLDSPIVDSREQFVSMHSDGYYSFVMGSLLELDQEEKQRLVSTYTQQLMPSA